MLLADHQSRDILRRRRILATALTVAPIGENHHQRMAIRIAVAVGSHQTGEIIEAAPQSSSGNHPAVRHGIVGCCIAPSLSCGGVRATGL